MDMTVYLYKYSCSTKTCNNTRAVLLHILNGMHIDPYVWSTANLCRRFATRLRLVVVSGQFLSMLCQQVIHSLEQ